MSEWHPVEGFPGYSISPEGKVRHDKNGRLLIPRINQYGVAYVGLMRGWEQCTRSLARLVACTFLSEPTDIFNTAMLLDGDPTNCRVDNIMWRPRWYAIKYKRQFQARYHRPIHEPVHAVHEREKFANSFDAALRYGLLEEEVVASIENNTLTWPTYQQFERLEMH